MCRNSAVFTLRLLMPELTGSMSEGLKLKETISNITFDTEGLVIDQEVEINGVRHRIAKFDDNGCVSIRFDAGTGKNFSFSAHSVSTSITNDRNDAGDDLGTVTVNFSRLKK